MRCEVSYSSTSSPWLLFFFAALLWGSTIHKHTGRWIWQGSASVPRYCLNYNNDVTAVHYQTVDFHVFSVMVFGAIGLRRLPCYSVSKTAWPWTQPAFDTLCVVFSHSLVVPEPQTYTWWCAGQETRGLVAFPASWWRRTRQVSASARRKRRSAPEWPRFWSLWLARWGIA